MRAPKGYVLVKIGELIPEGAIYLSTSGTWDQSPVYGVAHVNPNVSFAKLSAAKKPKDQEGDERWESI